MSKDLINRKELDKALYERFHEEDSPNNITDVPLGMVRSFIKNFQPPVNPQELCDDTISRQAAIDALTKTSGIRGDALKALYDLPPVTPAEKVGRWIPISERLPKGNTTVIGITRFGDIYKTELYDDCGKKKWYANSNYDVPIVAWMPLPEPYKAGSEEV